MNEPNNSSQPSRREFIKTTGKMAAVSALAGLTVPHVHGAEGNTINVALIGCGGRGTGAAENALSVKSAPLKLVAMADVFEHKLNGSYRGIKNSRVGSKVDVPDERKFIGFDAYQKAIDCLRPGDIAIFTSPLAFRWVHFAYAIEKKVHVFMEKPLTADGPTSRRLIQLAKEADAANLKVGVGLMSRHSKPMQELHKRIEDGEIGDIILMRGYRMHGPVGSFASTPKPDGMSDLMWQISRFHSFLWASGGSYSDFLIHHVDHCCWMKNGWPVKAQGLGGRHYKESPEGQPYVDQNFDTYSVEYVFDDGARFIMDGRCMTGCNDIYSSYAQGTKGSAIIARHGDIGTPSMTFKGHKQGRQDLIWQSTDTSNPYQNEWDALVEAILSNTPYNEVERGVYSSLVTSMGRVAAHSGQEITFEDMLNSEHEYAPGVDKLTMDSPSPLPADERGHYPQPKPGLLGKREY
ncbi:MAG TPA: streptomycin biosynthesis protein StrI [Verrucomicrobiales bacterium]|nr:streptomycin biosynthesis protein StrI [Verrucomicrobiales bacterium]